MEYICTNEDTNVTTTNITDDSESIFIDQLTSRVPDLIHEAITKLSLYPLITFTKTKIDNIVDKVINKQEIISEFLEPIFLPTNPVIIDANNGRKIIKYGILSF